MFNSTSEKDAYRNAIKKAKELKIEIKNPSIEHAGILIDELLEYAIEEKLAVKLVSGCLQKDFYDCLVGKFEKALVAGCKIDTLIECGEEEKIESKKLYELLQSSNNSTVNRLEKNDAVMHFMLVGDAAYRAETDKEYKTAIGHFDNKTIGDILLKKFDEYKQQALS